MSARTKARKRALDILFSADVRELRLQQALDAEAQRAAAEPQRSSSWSYAQQIVRGILENEAQIDQAITERAHGWTLERMPAVDRAIVRIGTWEILFNPDVPPAVAMSEAVQAARLLSTDDSPGFINGVLSAISRAQTD